MNSFRHFGRTLQNLYPHSKIQYSKTRTYTSTPRTGFDAKVPEFDRPQIITKPFGPAKRISDKMNVERAFQLSHFMKWRSFNYGDCQTWDNTRGTTDVIGQAVTPLLIRIYCNNTTLRGICPLHFTPLTLFIALEEARHVTLYQLRRWFRAE
jgi:hypothetical protein